MDIVWSMVFMLNLKRLNLRNIDIWSHIKMGSMVRRSLSCKILTRRKRTIFGNVRLNCREAVTETALQMTQFPLKLN